MNLKKNDKIILTVGVAILIIAGIGIAVYTSPDTDEIKAGDTEPDYLSFSYNWMRQTTDNIVGNDIYVEKSSTYNDNLAINSPTGSVMTSIEIQIIWEDDYTYGILRTKGEDTLTVTITDENGVSKTESGTGGNNITLQFNNINDIPSPDSILAEDTTDAMNILEGMISGENNANFDIEVNVETGERLFRPLKFLRDKGNDFQINAKYTYYFYELDEPIDDNDDDEDKTTNNDDGSNIGVGDFYKNLCYGRSMI
ncbi:MAG: hypothetical protein LN408_02405 [Candidatus Thermoplasmatota archaeon]|nr:hypothetical protein [Candidatus Thermoplasmatota archaeon]